MSGVFEKFISIFVEMPKNNGQAPPTKANRSPVDVHAMIDHAKSAQAASGQTQQPHVVVAQAPNQQPSPVQHPGVPQQPPSAGPLSQPQPLSSPQEHISNPPPPPINAQVAVPTVSAAPATPPSSVSVPVSTLPSELVITDVSPIVETSDLVDFDSIFKNAGVNAMAFSAERVLDMRDGLLQQGVTQDSMPQMMQVMVRMKCAETQLTIDDLLDDASRKVSALDDYATNVSSQEAEFVRVAQAEIQALQAKIDARRKEVNKEIAKRRKIADICRAHSARLTEVHKLLGQQVKTVSK